MNHKKAQDSGESGMTLVEVMISVGLLGIIFLFASRALYLGAFWKTTADVDHTLVLAKIDLLQMVDCNTTVSDSSQGGMAVPQCTFDANTCTAASNNKIRNDIYLPLKSKQRNADGSRRTLIATWSPIPEKGPSKTSSYGKLIDIRAGCGCCDKCINGKGVFVEYRRLSPTPGPLHEYQNMFGGMPLSCVVP